MKALLIILLCLSFYSQGQEVKTISYQMRLDLPQDTYVRLMRTADSLFKEYIGEPFQFQREDKSCCDKGLQVVKGFYKKALIESPKDEDAQDGLDDVNNLIEDEHLLFTETNHNKIIEKGDKYLTDAEYQRAIVMYKRALDFDPNSKAIKKKIKFAKKLIKENANI